MRPRKRILLVAGGTADKWQQFRLLLDTWGFVLWTEGYSECPDAVLAVDISLNDIPVLVCQHPDTRVIAMVRGEMDRSGAHALGAAFVATSHQELRERLKEAIARKRGPKKMPHPRQTERAA